MTSGSLGNYLSLHFWQRLVTIFLFEYLFCRLKFEIILQQDEKEAVVYEAGEVEVVSVQVLVVLLLVKVLLMQVLFVPDLVLEMLKWQVLVPILGLEVAVRIVVKVQLLLLFQQYSIQDLALLLVSVLEALVLMLAVRVF